MIAARTERCWEALKPNQNGGPWKAFAIVHGLGIQLVATILVGLWIGRWLDRMWHSAPWCTIAGIVIGLSAGIYAAVKIVKVFLEERNGQ